MFTESIRNFFIRKAMGWEKDEDFKTFISEEEQKIASDFFAYHSDNKICPSKHYLDNNPVVKSVVQKSLKLMFVTFSICLIEKVIIFSLFAILAFFLLYAFIF